MSRASQEFRPLPLLAGGHRQTLAGCCLPSRNLLAGTKRFRVELADGDQLVLHDDCPLDWLPGDSTALLVHGLCGCHQSRYVQRVALKLFQRGVRTFRIDLRGCGAGEGLARTATHCGRHSDLEPPVQLIGQITAASPLTVVGFSLGGALALGLAANSDIPDHWNGVIAVCPPIDLKAVERSLRRPINRWYDSFFARRLWKKVKHLAHTLPGAPSIDHMSKPRRLREFDQQFTVPLGGFRDVDEYYQRASIAPRLHCIELPTRIIAAANDPIVPIEPLREAQLGPRMKLLEARCGGHLGFVGRRGSDPDRYWMDWRIVEWISGKNGAEMAITTTRTSPTASPWASTS
ncbi:MAG: YheT family hydrolase [Aeoliella sp.]